VALFRTEVTDKQFFVFLATQEVSAQTLLNIDEVTLQGFEAELVYRTPLTGLDLFGAYGYLDSEIDKYTANEDYPTEGNHAPYVPEYTVNLGAEWNLPFFVDGVDFVARIDYQRLGPTYWQPEEFVKRDPVDLVNARVALQSSGDGKYMLAAWGKNLFEEEYNAESDGPYGFVHPAAPRTWGVDFTMRF
ncbi:MAG: TonB-dependent receptor, partial [Gammaproteobacteria bacterium]|nr:TonB-dependent receptor [Gammaproteobacteria bacterium]